MAQSQCAAIGPLIHPVFASQNSDSVACRASLADDLPPISVYLCKALIPFGVKTAECHGAPNLKKKIE